jgi:hypothetical protein
MTDSDSRPCLLQDDGTVKTIPGYAGYEGCDRGHINSRDRTHPDGRSYKGKALVPRRSNRGYQLVNVRSDTGKWETRTVHSLILLAHDGPPPPGQVTRHLNDDSDDNRWPENLAYGTAAENERDKFANGTRKPAAPKPERRCVRCAVPLEPGRGGKRCHECVTEIGEQAADLLRAGVSLDEVADKLDYPHLSGLHQLARVYGGYGLQGAPAAVVMGRGEGKSATALAAFRRILRRRGSHAR